MEFGLQAIGSSTFLVISKTEYDEMVIAKVKLLETLAVEEKFDLVVENYLELESCLLDVTARNMVLRTPKYHAFQVQRNLFNRRLVNLLSSCRSYIDYAKHNIRVMQPEDQGGAARIMLAFSDHYDKSVGYRVMEALRNHVQHRGFPIHAVTYTTGRGRKEDDIWKFGLSIYAKISYLREDGEFKKSVLKELENLGGRINLKPMIRDYVAALGNVHDMVREMIRPSVEKWDRVISDAILRFKEHSSESSVKGLTAVKRDQGELKCSVPIFIEITDYRKALQHKNGDLMQLGKRYVTGEVIKKES